MLLQQDCGNATHRQVNSPSEDLKLAKEEVAQAQESLKVMRGSYFQMLWYRTRNVVHPDHIDMLRFRTSETQ